MTTSEKVAYLKGLMEGMKLDTENGEGKLLHLIADILGGMAEDIEDALDDICDLSEDIDAIGDALSELEDCCLSDEDDAEPVFFEFTCPECGKTVTVDEDVLELGTIQCPECGEMMDLSLDEEG